MERVTVVDTGAIVRGWSLLSPDEKYCCPEGVLEEVRDKAGRERLERVDLRTQEPDNASLALAKNVAVLTGDLSSISRVDLQVIALGISEARRLGIKLRSLKEVEALLSNPRIGARARGQATEAPPPTVDEIGIKAGEETKEAVEDDEGWTDGKGGTGKRETLRLLASESHGTLKSTTQFNDEKVELRIDSANTQDVPTDCGEADEADEADEAGDVDEEDIEVVIRTGLDSEDNEDDENEEEEDEEEFLSASNWVTEESLKNLDGDGCRAWKGPESKRVVDGLDEKNEKEEEQAGEQAGEQSGADVVVGGGHKDGEEEDQNLRVKVLTGDFAMQNVLLAVGVPVVSPTGRRIRTISQWVLMCGACYKVTKDQVNPFCGKCGYASLRRVPLRIDADGKQCVTIIYRRAKLKGTIATQPRPKGGKKENKNILRFPDHIYMGGRDREMRRRRNLASKQFISLVADAPDAKTYATEDLRKIAAVDMNWAADFDIERPRGNRNSNHFTKHNKKK